MRIISIYISSILFLSAVLGSGLFASAAGAATRAKATRVSRHDHNGVSCEQCHGTAKKHEAVGMDKCLECHGDTKDLAAKTAQAKPRNPHESRHYGTEADCNLCHHEHVKSENHCLGCHPRFTFQVP